MSEGEPNLLMDQTQPTDKRKLSKHNQYYQRNREQQKAKSLEYYHKIGKARRQMKNEAARKHKAAVEGLRGSDEEDSPLPDNTMGSSDSNQSERSDSDSDESSCDGWYDSDASAEGGLLSIDTTFLKQYQSKHWLRDRDDTVDYRIRCLDEDLKLWFARWGGVENWPDISADPAQEMQIRGQMELGIQYATLIRQVWGAKVRGRVVESAQVEMYWEKTAKMMSHLYDALSLLGTYMHWDSE